jgi:hypothetical protein
MVLVDGDEFRAETHSDDGDTHAVGHGLLLAKE